MANWRVRPVGQRWEIVAGTSAFCMTFSGENEASAVADVLNRHAAEIAEAVKTLGVASRVMGDLAKQNQERAKENERLSAEIVRLRADAAKDVAALRALIEPARKETT